MPEGRHHLDVYWDFANDELTHEQVDLSGATITRNGELLNLSGTVAHTYDGLTGETAFSVRAQLWIEGKTGNCARVRHITVTPPVQQPCATVNSKVAGFVPTPSEG